MSTPHISIKLSNDSLQVNFRVYGAYARDVIGAMLVYRQQKSWFIMVNQHGHHSIVIGIPWDWLHTLYIETFKRDQRAFLRK